MTRLGYLVEEAGVTYVVDVHGLIDPDNLLAPLQAASCTYRIAFGPHAERKVVSLQYAASRTDDTMLVRQRPRLKLARGSAARK